MAAASVNGKGLGSGQQGYTYMGALLLMALMGLMLATAGEVWSTVGQRERERQLLWVGTQYAQALRSYYRSAQGVAQYPATLEELLEDHRFPSIRRHLRRLYPDPLTGSAEWGLIHSIDGRITGVYSLSSQIPLKQANFPAQWADFEGMASYADWRFVAENAFLETAPARPDNGQATPGGSQQQ